MATSPTTPGAAAMYGGQRGPGASAASTASQTPYPVAAQPAPAAAPAPSSLAALYGGSAPAVDYGGAFTGAINTQRAGIQQQFNLAIDDIGKREGLANQAVGQLPGQLSTIYNQGDASLMRGAAGLEDAQKASGLHSFMSAGAQMAPLAAARQNDLSARQADVPLLQLAMQGEFARQRGAVNQARIGSENEINGQLASYYSGLAQAQASKTDSTRQALLQHELDRADTLDERAYNGRVADADFRRQLRLKGEDPSTEVEGLSKKKVQQIRESKAYKDARELMLNTKKHHGGTHLGPIRLGGHDTGHKAASPQEIYEKLRATHPQTLKVLISEDPELAAFVAGLGA